MKKYDMLPEQLPKHIAFIMDGNGRWAKKRAMPREYGHRFGVKAFRQIIKLCSEMPFVEAITFYAFSTENWKRPEDEVNGIMNLLRDYLKDAENFKDENIRVRFIGDRTPLADDIKELMAKNENDSKNATGLTLYIAINYGGRDEIVKAVQKIVDSGIKADEINEQLISNMLYTCDCPDPDFIIRPSGEYRISNYLIWQSAYSEFWYSDILWPDFTEKHLEKAIADFNKRNRRFGGI